VAKKCRGDYQELEDTDEVCQLCCCGELGACVLHELVIPWVPSSACPFRASTRAACGVVRAVRGLCALRLNYCDTVSLIIQSCVCCVLTGCLVGELYSSGELCKDG